MEATSKSEATMRIHNWSYVLAGSGSSPEVGSFSRSGQGSDNKYDEGEISGHCCLSVWLLGRDC